MANFAIFVFIMGVIFAKGRSWTSNKNGPGCSMSFPTLLRCSGVSPLLAAFSSSPVPRLLPGPGWPLELVQFLSLARRSGFIGHDLTIAVSSAINLEPQPTQYVACCVLLGSSKDPFLMAFYFRFLGQKKRGRRPTCRFRHGERIRVALNDDSFELLDLLLRRCGKDGYGL